MTVMRIIAPIPVRIIEHAAWFQFENEDLEVEVLRVIRNRCDRTRLRYFYEADVIPPAATHPRALEVLGYARDCLRVNISRRLNPRWRAPVFPMGSNVWQAGQG